MINKIFKIEFNSTKKALLIWCGILAVILVFTMAMFPMMNSTDMQQPEFPPEMMKSLGFDNMPDFSNILEFLGMSFQNLILVICIYAMILGTTTLIKEETYGTIEYLYAQPITRPQIVFGKIISSVVTFTLFNLFLNLFAGLLVLLFKPSDVNFINILPDFLKMMLGVYFSGIVFLFIGFLVSTTIKSAKQAIPLGLGVVLVSYILSMLAKSLSSKVEFLEYIKYISPLDYGNPTIILNNGFDIWCIIIGLGLIICTSIATLTIYNKKDFKD